jgi:hypothetical protein
MFPRKRPIVEPDDVHRRILACLFSTGIVLALVAARKAHATEALNMRVSGFLAAAGSVALLALACEKPADGADPSASSDNAITGADAQCLHNASNADLVAELSTRLSSSGGTTTTSGAAGSFTCDSSTNLTIGIIGPTGTEQTKEIFTGSAATCQTAATKLNATRGSITHTALIGVCDSSTNLQRFSATPDGALTQLSAVFTGSASSCATQADAMNH